MRDFSYLTGLSCCVRNSGRDGLCPDAAAVGALGRNENPRVAAPGARCVPTRHVVEHDRIIRARWHPLRLGRRHRDAGRAACVRVVRVPPAEEASSRARWPVLSLMPARPEGRCPRVHDTSGPSPGKPKPTRRADRASPVSRARVPGAAPAAVAGQAHIWRSSSGARVITGSAEICAACRVSPRRSYRLRQKHRS